jgi:nucleoside-diphosphate-sugar epimerase
MKPRVLVTGANGFVGKSLCSELSSDGYPAIATTRSIDMSISDVKQIFIASIDKETDWSSSLNNVDVVIHLAARVHVMDDKAIDPLSEFRRVNVAGTLNLARQAAEAGVTRFIFISSIKVNGDFTALGMPFRENDVVIPADDYALSKFEAEIGLYCIAKETGMEVVIIRPPLVYGIGVKANFVSMIRLIKKGIPLPLGAIHNRRSFVYVGNLVSLIMCCIIHPAAANQTFLVSDDYDLSTTELIKRCASSLGVKARLLPVPQAWIKFFALLIGRHDLAKRLCGNLQADISKAKKLLGWSPPFLINDGLLQTCVNLDKLTISQN